MIIQQYVTVHHVPKYCHKAIAVKTVGENFPTKLVSCFFRTLKENMQEKNCLCNSSFYLLLTTNLSGMSVDTINMSDMN